MNHWHEVKSMGCWGMQNGLMSEVEIEHLAALIEHHRGPRRVLEVGHYYGLSTYVIANALGPNGTLLSIDAHIKDAWVKDSNEGGYFANIRKHFTPCQVQTIIMDSRAVKTLDGFDVVFYDGDHAEEQERFTRLVMASETVDLFIFDDRDFPVPERCCDILRDAGWRDCSPNLWRGGGDKMHAGTMTLGVFKRGKYEKP